jgi:hypothetical protein
MPMSLKTVLRWVCLLGAFCAWSARAQETTSPPASSDNVLLENKHLRVVQLEIPASKEIKLPVLQNDALLVIRSGDGDEVYSSGKSEAVSRRGAREVVWLQRDEQFSVFNQSNAPSTVLHIEFKDSYNYDQVLVPASPRDPLDYDTKHFRLLLENNHARVFLLHLEPRESSEEVQVPLHLEIPFQTAKVEVFTPDGNFQEQTRDASKLQYGGNRLASIANQERTPFEELLIELRHPFCYKLYAGAEDGRNANTNGYAMGLYQRIRKQWLKRLPSDVKYGEEKGLVTVKLRLKADGTEDEDETSVMEIFGASKLMDTALRSLREAGPFQAFPPDAGKPYLDFRYTFVYNLSLQSPPGCEFKSEEKTEPAAK